MNDAEFLKWFANKLTLGGFPYTVNGGFTPSEYTHCINVSDKYCNHAAMRMLDGFCLPHWFPMINCDHTDIGLNNIYGAMCVMHQALMSGDAVYLHCSNGNYNSHIVAQCFYYMHMCEHFGKWWGGGFIGSPLSDACAKRRLPPLTKMERFLSLLGRYLDDARYVDDMFYICKSHSFI